MERKAFITGAASGIGRATAELFAEKGFWIGAADRDAAGLEKLRGELGDERCRTWVLDVTDGEAWRRVIDELADETGGRLDLLFNNAGIGVGGSFDEVPLEESLRVVDINLVGVLRGIHAAAPLLKATPGSLCFSTSSSAAIYGAPGLAVYAATKFAVKGLTEALAVELARHDVRVADVLPGVIDTAIFASSPVYADGKRQTMAGVTAAAAASEGPFRLVPPRAVAEAVWRCYQGDPRMHWYVPEELEALDKQKAESPEAARDARIAAQQQAAAALPDDA